jgi:uncharacterized protein YciI
VAALQLEEFELVFLRRPPEPTPYDEKTLDRIQSEHLAYLSSLRDSGQLVVNGPVTDHADESLRGLAFYRAGSLEEARRLAEADPAVRAGRLVIEVMHWWCPPARMVAPGRAFVLDADD